jgi:ubiquinone/menaquinone biosynthesis C-methylase UbiE
MITEKDISKEELKKKMLKEYEIEHKYFLDENGKNHWLKKPFSGIEEAGSYCMQLGRLIGGLKLARGMTILDWGAGSCWMSEIMNKLGMNTIALDITKTGLDVGKKLFKMDQRIDKSLKHEFMHYDGRKIPLPDNSIDRIVISWAFHHIVNKIEMLKEFYRVLKKDGIVGMMDAGLKYSESDMAIHEKHTFGALEDNIDLEKVEKIIKNIGYKNIKITYSPEANLMFDFEGYDKSQKHKDELFKNCLLYGSTHEVFFLIKGSPYVNDSAKPGKNCKAKIKLLNKKIYKNKIQLKINIQNVGDTKFLSKNNDPAGIIYIGSHLYDKYKNLIKLDFKRSKLSKDLNINDNCEVNMEISIPKDFDGFIEIDLVNEGHWWFKQKGTKTLMIKINE